MMTFPKYSKIETLFARDEKTFKVVEGNFRRPEFAIIDRWDVTEKIDGTNVRIHLPMNSDVPDGDPVVHFGGRTDSAQMPTFLLDYLQRTFKVSKMLAAFPDLMDAHVTLFGEGYGAKIQKGGNYRKDAAFRLFDVLIHGCPQHRDVWLKQEDVLDVANKLGIGNAPSLCCTSVEEIVNLVQCGYTSLVAMYDGGTPEHLAEGVVARSPHGLLDRMGCRIMWKLKTRDF